MRNPNLREEKRLWREGYQNLAGLDEAGRGAWAGPLVGAAVILSPKIKIKGIRDSKLLTPDGREKLFLAITKQTLGWAIGIVSEKIIDKIGIQEANLLALKLALKKLRLKPDYLLIDYLEINSDIPQKTIVNGDLKVCSIAAASIMAKVTRDYILSYEHKNYPLYKFNQHKGYGTEYHLKMIKKYGLCRLHRKTFRPMISF